MAIYHLSMSAIQRSAGRSAVASASYRSGEKLHDPRQGMTFDYGKISDRILNTGLFFPDGVTMSRQELWGGIELHHKRGDSVTAREIEVALPHELTDEKRKIMVGIIAKQLAEKHKCAVDFAIHKSSGEGGNVHAHIMMTACTVTPEGFGKKINELDPIWCKRNEVQPLVERIRPGWEKLVNKELENAGVENRIDHRTLEAQGIDRPPQIHEGPYKRSEKTKRIRERNQKIKSLWTEKNQLENAIEAEKNRINTANQFEKIVRENSTIVGRLTDSDVKKICYACGKTGDADLIDRVLVPWLNAYVEKLADHYTRQLPMAKTQQQHQEFMEAPARIQQAFIDATKQGIEASKRHPPLQKPRQNTRDDGLGW